MADFTTHRTEFGPFRWYVDPRKCSHSNDDACPTCDHDGYYQTYVTSPAVCSGCGHGAHVPGLCEADEQPACNCLTDSDTSPGGGPST